MTTGNVALTPNVSPIDSEQQKVTLNNQPPVVSTTTNGSAGVTTGLNTNQKNIAPLPNTTGRNGYTRAQSVDASLNFGTVILQPNGELNFANTGFLSTSNSINTNADNDQPQVIEQKFTADAENTQPIFIARATNFPSTASDQSTTQPLITPGNTNYVRPNFTNTSPQTVAIGGSAPLSPRVQTLQQQYFQAPRTVVTPGQSLAPTIPPGSLFNRVTGSGITWSTPVRGTQLNTTSVNIVDRFLQNNGLAGGLPSSWTQTQRDYFVNLTTMAAQGFQPGQEQQLTSDLTEIFARTQSLATQVPDLTAAPILTAPTSIAALPDLPPSSTPTSNPLLAFNERVTSDRGDLRQQLFSTNEQTSQAAYQQARNELRTVIQNTPGITQQQVDTLSRNLDSQYLSAAGMRAVLNARNETANAQTQLQQRIDQKQQQVNQLSGEARTRGQNELNQLVQQSNHQLARYELLAQLRGVQAMFNADNGTNADGSPRPLLPSYSLNNTTYDRQNIRSAINTIQQQIQTGESQITSIAQTNLVDTVGAGNTTNSSSDNRGFNAQLTQATQKADQAFQQYQQALTGSTPTNQQTALNNARTSLSNDQFALALFEVRVAQSNMGVFSSNPAEVEQSKQNELSQRLGGLNGRPVESAVARREFAGLNSNGTVRWQDVQFDTSQLSSQDRQWLSDPQNVQRLAANNREGLDTNQVQQFQRVQTALTSQLATADTYREAWNQLEAA